LPSPLEVANAEQALGLSFHPDYCQYLLRASDIAFGTKEPAVVLPEAPPHLSLIRIANDGWSAGVQRDLLPFCEDNGNYFCLSASGRVICWVHDGSNGESWPDLAAWLKQVWIDGG
jgi:hypothetical protein